MFFLLGIFKRSARGARPVAFEPGDEVIDHAIGKGGIYYQDFNFNKNFPRGCMFFPHNDGDLPAFCENKDRLVLVRKNSSLLDVKAALKQ